MKTREKDWHEEANPTSKNEVRERTGGGEGLRGSGSEPRTKPGGGVSDELRALVVVASGALNYILN